MAKSAADLQEEIKEDKKEKKKKHDSSSSDSEVSIAFLVLLNMLFRANREKRMSVS